MREILYFIYILLELGLGQIIKFNPHASISDFSFIMGNRSTASYYNHLLFHMF